MAEAAAAMQTPPIRALHPLDGRYHAGPGIALTPGSPRALVALHLSESALEPVGNAIGIDLPRRPKSSVERDGLAALWLGPDDLMLLVDAPAETLVAAVEGSGAPDGPSAVDVSDRFVSVVLEGAAAEAVLAGGCPQDLRLRTFPVGAATRTVLARSEVTLWRTAETRFELFCGRSFANYVWAFLVEAARAPSV